MKNPAIEINLKYDRLKFIRIHWTISGDSKIVKKEAENNSMDTTPAEPAAVPTSAPTEAAAVAANGN